MQPSQNTKSSDPHSKTSTRGMLLKGGGMKTPGFASGGLIDSLKRAVGMAPEETMREKYARQDAERAASRQKPAEAAPEAPAKAVTDYAAGTGTANRMKAIDTPGYANGGKIKGPGTATSDSIPAKVTQTGQPINVSTGERIVSAAQDELLGRIAKAMGFKTVDAMLESGTGKPVGPTVQGGTIKAAAGKPPGWTPELDAAQKKALAMNDLPPATPAVQTDSPVITKTVSQGGSTSYGDNASSSNGSSYGDQMANVGKFVASGAGSLLKAAVSAPGYGFNSSSQPQATAEVASKPTATPAVTGPTPSAAAAPATLSASTSGVRTIDNSVNSQAGVTSGANGQRFAPGAVSEQEIRTGAAMTRDAFGGRAMDGTGQNFSMAAKNPDVQNNYNESQRMQGSGVRASTDSKGGLLLTNSGSYDGSTKMPYVDAKGNPTSDYKQTAQYAQGITDAGNVKRMADSMERERLVQEAGSALKGYSKPAQAQLAAIDKGNEIKGKQILDAANMAGTNANTKLTNQKVMQGDVQMAQQEELQNPNTSPERIEAIRRSILASHPDQNGVKVLSGGVDPATGQKAPDSYVLMKNGQISEAGTAADWKANNGSQSAGPLPAGLKVGAATKQADGTYSANGKMVTIRNGKITEIK